MMVRLVDATDDHFAWFLGEASAEKGCGLFLPPGGIDETKMLLVLRNLTRKLHQARCFGSWLVVEDHEIVGLCSYKWPPDSEGEVEIGYGIAPSRRNHGYATRAVAELLLRAAADPVIHMLRAETALANEASQKVLAKNGFERSGTRTDPEEGEMLIWKRMSATRGSEEDR